jgi:ribosomal protein S12 methylthiotransferase
MAIQQGISGELMQRLVGTVQRVVIDRKEGEYFIGRTQFDSPEVDCEVLIEKLRVLSPREARLFESLELKEVEELKVGEFYNVEITKAEEFDLYGEVVSR